MKNIGKKSIEAKKKKRFREMTLITILLLLKQHSQTYYPSL